MKTQQTGSEVPPPSDDDTLAIILKCPKCDTQRAFRVNDSFMLVITRKTSGCEYATQCNICGYKVSVQLAWTKRHLGWVAEKLVFTKSVLIEDNFGMTKKEGEKKI